MTATRVVVDPITRIEGKLKLGQNRSPADLAGVHRALSQSQDAGDRALAGLMVSEGLAAESTPA